MTDIQLIGLAKARVDNGFSQVGRALKPEQTDARVLMLLASRAIAMANALIVLSQHSHSNEALPVLRSLFEVVCAMRWITEADAAARAQAFLDENRNSEWERFLVTPRLKERMRALGFPREVQETALLSAYNHLHANAQGLPWGHVFGENGHKGLGPEELLAAASFLMGHVVKSLDIRWPGKFSSAEWEHTRG